MDNVHVEYRTVSEVIAQVCHKKGLVDPSMGNCRGMGRGWAGKWGR